MSKKRLFILNGLSILLVLSTVIIMKFAKHNMEFVEAYYSRGFYPLISTFLNYIANLIPFSLGETVLFILVGYVVYRLIIVVREVIKKEYKVVLEFATVLILIITFNVFYYNISWGLNNYRQETKVLFNLVEDNSEDETEDKITDIVTIDTLAQTYQWLTIETNRLRTNLEEDENGVALVGDLENILDHAYEGYTTLHESFEFVSDKKVIVKPLILSYFMNRSGYSGVYLYYVGEPNLNKLQPIYTIPFTACHEIAHQKGFAYEDDANYIGFLACQANENEFIQYSGYYGMLKYVGNAIYKYDTELYFQLKEDLSEGVLRDLAYERDYWDRTVDEKAEEISDKINDTYLKANNQEEGVLNYSEVVELIVLDYLARNTHE